MITLVDQPRRRRRLAVLALAATLLAPACTSGGGSQGPVREGDGPNTVPPPTLAGGVDLPSVDVLKVLVGTGLAYGEPLPSQQAAADAYLQNPEVSSVVARRLYSQRDGRLLGEVTVLALDGAELFDEGVLDAFVRASVAAHGDGSDEEVQVAGRSVARSQSSLGTSMGFLEGDQLVLVRGAHDGDVAVVVERQLRAIAAGATGSAEPVTPLVALPIDAAFVAVPTLTFEAIPPPEEEPVPEAPTLAGATAVQGRYGVVAGERRTTVWAFTLDPATYPSGEALGPALVALASARAGGAPAAPAEVVDRVVHRADGADGNPSARVFRHKGLVLVVEGMVPAQLDAVVSAWITALL